MCLYELFIYIVFFLYRVLHFNRKFTDYLFCLFPCTGPHTSIGNASRNNHNINNRAASAPMKLMRSSSSRQRIHIPEISIERNLIQTKNFDHPQTCRPTSTSTCVSAKSGSFKTQLSAWKKQLLCAHVLFILLFHSCLFIHKSSIKTLCYSDITICCVPNFVFIKYTLHILHCLNKSLHLAL